MAWFVLLVHALLRWRRDVQRAAQDHDRVVAAAAAAAVKRLDATALGDEGMGGLTAWVAGWLVSIDRSV